MLSDRRQSQRRAINRLGKIQLGGGLPRDCLVTNISNGGVRLHVEGYDVPDRFMLVLQGDGAGHRPLNCQVIWRLGCELGAEFVSLASQRAEDNSKGQKRPAHV